MKIKSWQVALAGIFAQLAFALLFLKFAGGAEGAGGFIFFLIGLSVIYGTALGIVPAALLYFSKTRIVGAIAAVLFGLIGVFSSFAKIVGLFLIASGILFLWRGE
jgi:hypothetical protein